MSAIPVISKNVLIWFRWYVRRFLKKSFHSFCISRSSADCICPPSGPGQESETPRQNFVIFGNHSSWWDPLVAMHLAETYFPAHKHFSPIESEALEKYGIFKRLGFYPIDKQSRKGAVNFLRQSQAILDEPDSCIWMTPEGQFADVRNHELPFEPGLAHLASRVSQAWLLPLAIEITFWEEKLPEIFCRFGEPIQPDPTASKDVWNARLHSALRKNQSALADEVISRDETKFNVLLSGKSGVSSFYDWIRRLGSWVTGRSASLDHGQKLKDRNLVDRK